MSDARVRELAQENEVLRAKIRHYEETLTMRDVRRMHPDGTWTFEIDTMRLGDVLARLAWHEANTGAGVATTDTKAAALTVALTDCEQLIVEFEFVEEPDDLREAFARCTKTIDVKECVERFLTWPLPSSVCADLCASKPGASDRSGTNLLSAAEAREMFMHCLGPVFRRAGAPPALPPWTIEKTSCACGREDDGHGWALLKKRPSGASQMVRCVGCLASPAAPAPTTPSAGGAWTEEQTDAAADVFAACQDEDILGLDHVCAALATAAPAFVPPIVRGKWPDWIYGSESAMQGAADVARLYEDALRSAGLRVEGDGR